MTDLFQSALDLDVQEEPRLSDFTSVGYQAVIIATQKLCQGELPEIFIYGKKGSGKSHLALAIYNEYTKTGKTAISLSLDKMIESEGDDASALQGLQLFNLVILDDVEAVAHSHEWQEGLFHLINEVRREQKQLVFLANDPARELDINLLDLLTRLSLAPAFKLPDGDRPADREAMLKSILRRKNWRLPPVIFEYLVSDGPYNATDMMSVLDSISPLLTRLARTPVSKKTLEDTKKIIDKETLLLELGDYIDDMDG
ncbi:DnaA-homolog protein hda [Moraxella caprae]|uniref:DnaA-homolog protein hda n=1 Tax=Moraxella caprae TaxID=90240 RepID=A0A378R4U8_9GAMM|nr:DnaA/Hda family protein [Moraxella caprae]STZ08900.1 DnaA-homolog protein hda [Moraxella caprae]